MLADDDDRPEDRSHWHFIVCMDCLICAGVLIIVAALVTIVKGCAL